MSQLTQFKYDLNQCRYYRLDNQKVMKSIIDKMIQIISKLLTDGKSVLTVDTE